MKTLLKVVGALILLLLVAGLAAVLFVDHLAVEAVERGGTYALGVPTRLDSADVGLLNGNVGLSGLRVDNPEGFESPAFLTLEGGRMQVALDSLRQDVVRAPELSFDGVTLHIERKSGRTNYGVLLENLERLQDPSAPSDPEPGGKKFVIDTLVVRNIDAHFDLLPMGGKLTRVRVQVPEIRLEDIGSGGGASVAEITAVLVKAILQAGIEAAGSKLPTELLGDLRAQLEKLGELGPDLGEQLKGLGEGALKGTLERLKR